ncbi:uncharacterized protein LOC129578277 [Sitodiplosis mosellana]|uniref:uncharacterized protein LOC129578277 n=1 Tax=Sitodiplosis mosellana TaxID=263140 RepID=UPI002444016C|nr:uncharacterized protein LOC129578277 [Sitodiplosis mosellana]XP_055322553.1 uncharacterized protein LOC129578277 [Sitodiplosis mosellana]XP_055322554.1 uncharacterized protein LOC129578277 [Sitodiplosis mosellana]XP_055322555.1 uncharacterized protein LOC129578277 [Sitodiplosis mosellana]XP_055322556.1 uncharacterized protein LOC129578277 [Sitodiplosis mosellana]XP_055322557.1 uncharacterized protein LOC129578277 [Sitodiplosis mosellana]XP_055322558.1 uncharacterized protein LOC129578277 [
METFQTKNQRNYAKPLKMSSIEETIQLARLQQAANASSLYERKPNQKALKVLTVAAYILFVSMAAIILSFYYVFIWDPTTKSMAPRPPTNCETAKKIVIPESIAIKLANSSEVSAEYFFRDIYRRYQQLQNKERKGVKASKRNRIHKVPNTELATNREHKKIMESIRSTVSTVSTIDISSIGDRSTMVPFQQQQQSTTSNSFIMQTKDQVAYVDDEDLENDLEASGLNRIRNETSIAYNFDENNDN